MLHMMRLMLAGVVLFWAGAAAAQQINNPVSWVRGFLERLTGSGIDPAFAYWAAGASNDEGFRAQLNSANQAYGAIRSIGSVLEARLGERLSRVQVVMYYDTHPWLMSFVFYQTDAGWRLLNWRTNGDVWEFPFGAATGPAAP